MHKLQPMYQRDAPSGNLSSFPTSKKSPYSNYRQHISRNQSIRGKGCTTVRSNGKILEQFHADQRSSSTYGIKHVYTADIQRQNGSRSPGKENENARSIDIYGIDKNSRYKTEICRNFKERANCIYGEQCQFAHGRQELRDAIRNNKYKTKSCQKYWVTGYCAYGPRCNFLHYESGENYDTKSEINVDEKQIPTELWPGKYRSNLVQDKSPTKSEDELAETVEEVISTGRGILNQMEKDKIACDPSLEDLFVKLKRALPPKRSSTPVFNGSNLFDMSRTSSLTIEKNDEKRDDFYSSNWNYLGNITKGNIIAATQERALKPHNVHIVEPQDHPKYSTKADIFSWIDTWSK